MKSAYLFYLCFLFFFFNNIIYSQNEKNELARLDSLGEYYFYQGNLDSSFYFFNQEVFLAKKQNKHVQQLKAYNWLFYLQIASDQKDSLDNYIAHMLNLAKKINPNSSDKADILSSFWNSKSYYHSLKEEFLQQIECAKKSLHYYEMVSDVDSSELAINYQNLGASLEQIGDYYQAINYSKKALNLLRPSNSRTNIQLDSLLILNSIVRQLFFLKDFHQAEKYFHEAKKICSINVFQKNKEVHKELIKFYIFHGDHFLKQDKYILAQKEFQKAKSILKQSKENNIYNPILSRYFARAALAQGKYQKAEELTLAAKKIVDQKFNTRTDQLIETQELLGNIYLAKKEYQKALKAYQDVLHYICLDFTSNDVQKNPTLKQIFHSKNKALRVLRKKADALSSIQQHTAALTTYQLAIQLFNNIRADYLTEDAQLFLSEETIPLFEKAIESAIQQDKPEFAFQFVEQSKSLLLYEALQEKEAYHLAGIPDSITQQIRQLKIQHNYWEKELFEKQSKKDANKIKIADDKLFKISRQQEILTEKINKEFPKFSKLKFSKTNISLADIRNQILAPNSALIEYFITDKNIFLFGISKEELIVKKIPKDKAFEERITSILKILHLEKNANPNEFSKHAHSLFEKYLSPILNAFPKAINELYIIPDGLLNYIPFEILLTNSNNTTAYSTLPYLINSYTCSYAYSASLLLKTKDNTVTKGGSFVGFAPVFDTNKTIHSRNEKLAQLNYSLETVESIRALTNGFNYTYDEANKSNLLNPSKQPLVLHLSTHAKMDDQNPLGSQIYLADGSLSTKEIYSLSYSTQLAVLSACETGTGKLHKGEGLMSLARAFMQSGSPSVVTSLWKVDDKATSELMLNFYKNLLEGFPKNKAIHQAKLDYLKSKESEILHHPYYWAAFIQIGNIEAIDFPKGRTKWIYGALVVFVILLLFILRNLFVKSYKSKSK